MKESSSNEFLFLILLLCDGQIVRKEPAYAVAWQRRGDQIQSLMDEEEIVK